MKTERLPVKLTEDEIREKGKKLAQLMHDKTEVEVEAKNTAAGFKLRIKDIESAGSTLAHEIKSGKEMRQVEVHEQFDYRRGVVEVLRADTMEPIFSRALKPEERQERLRIDTDA